MPAGPAELVLVKRIFTEEGTAGAVAVADAVGVAVAVGVGVAVAAGASKMTSKMSTTSTPAFVTNAAV